ncbi:alpha/beta-hydrolase [Aspergillus novoparasiticus]|uniref:Alpha/beta-hydrolase n=1 Tax=Aspergillus novoparasiticus TaxID=986946 RepID=A0A5N6E8C8_9EURO|nr:alpha/beta-hydrolase [Aspergillus novoparasiticus]
MSQRLPLVVLVPGAWHKPTCFKQLQHELRTLGLPSATVAHPSVGSSSVPLKTLTDDVASPRHTLENISDNGDEIVLLMHSYGGVVGSAAAKDLSISQRRAQGKSGGILMMIYLAAFALPAGTSLFEAAGGTAPAWWEYRIYSNDSLRSNPADVFYNDLTEDAQRYWISQLLPTAAADFELPSTYEPWKDITTMYIYTEQDHAIPLQMQQSMVARIGDVETASLNSSHSPFLSIPGIVAGLVQGALQQDLRRNV